MGGVLTLSSQLPVMAEIPMGPDRTADIANIGYRTRAARPSRAMVCSTRISSGVLAEDS